MGDLLVDSGWENKTARQLASWDPYDQNASSPFFDPEWMFGLTHGFDVVIGNPPYLESKKLPLEIKSNYAHYQSATGTGKFDLYVLFVEKGLVLTKKAGILSYINPTTFMNKGFGLGLRKLLSQNYKIKRIINFGDIQVFENATNYTGIFEVLNSSCDDYSFNYIKYSSKSSIDVKDVKDVKDFNDSLCLPNNFDFCDSVFVDKNSLNQTSWNFRNTSEQTIVDLIEKDSELFKTFVKYIFVGVQSGKDEVFFVSKEDVVKNDLEAEILHPILNGKDVRRYELNWSDTFIIYPYHEDNTVINETELKTKHPNVFKYLSDNSSLLSDRPYFEKSNKAWYELWCERKLSKFKEIKIVNAEISPENRFYLDNQGYLGNTKIFCTVLKEKYRDRYLYFLGLLNSKLFNYYHKQIASPKAGGFYDYKTQFISLYPIKLDSCYLQIDFLVQLIASYLNTSHKSFLLISEIIDALVFEIYFPYHMKERKIDVLGFVEKDIEEVMQNREFRALSDIQKEQVVTELHKHWIDPESEIVKRMNSFAEKSPEILKPILEG